MILKNKRSKWALLIVPCIITIGSVGSIIILKPFNGKTLSIKTNNINLSKDTPSTPIGPENDSIPFTPLEPINSVPIGPSNTNIPFTPVGPTNIVPIGPANSSIPFTPLEPINITPFKPIGPINMKITAQKIEDVFNPYFKNVGQIWYHDQDSSKKYTIQVSDASEDTKNPGNWNITVTTIEDSTIKENVISDLSNVVNEKQLTQHNWVNDVQGAFSSYIFNPTDVKAAFNRTINNVSGWYLKDKSNTDEYNLSCDNIVDNKNKSYTLSIYGIKDGDTKKTGEYSFKFNGNNIYSITQLAASLLDQLLNDSKTDSKFIFNYGPDKATL